MKLLTVLGARPQFIKAAAVSRAMRAHAPALTEIIVHTGQHYDRNMSAIFFEQMNIPRPDFNLEVAGLDHGAMTGRMLEKIEAVILSEKPDRVLVYGDTNSTLAGALAAIKLHVPVAHVEAGLRSFNTAMPEEINRILTDRVSDLLFCPTRTAVENLLNEGYGNFAARIHQVGDVMQDAALYYADKSQRPKQLDPEEEGYVLVTIHRAENTDDPTRLAQIVDALNRIESTGVSVVLPLHPRTREKLDQAKLILNARISDPVGYLEMIFLIQHCSLVMTDSGGLQKEAYFFSRPCVTMRTETEWTELVEHGVNRLAIASSDEIFDAYLSMRDLSVNAELNLYGGGRASQKIVSILNNGN